MNTNNLKIDEQHPRNKHVGSNHGSTKTIKDNQLESLMSLTDQHEFWLDEAQEPFVTFPVNTPVNLTTGQTSNVHYENWTIKSAKYRELLTYEYYSNHKMYPSKGILDQVIDILAGKTAFGGIRHKTYVRTAPHEGSIFIDLTNDQWEYAEITAAGWSVTQGKPAVKFLRTPNVKPMFTPDAAGDFSSLRQVFRLNSQDDYILLAAWLMFALAGKSQYPILALEGVAGSSKSTLTKQIGQLIDPRTPAIQGQPRNLNDFSVSANNTHLIALDNLSKINQDLSDTLCGIATGTGFCKRKLYSDSTEVHYDVCKPIVLNSINSVINFSDLADRSIRLSLPSISSQTTLSNASGEEPLPHYAQGRLSNEKVDEHFQNAAPKILGALFSAIQMALPHYRNVKDLPAEIRMMDFAQWGVAASGAFAMSGNIDFVSILTANLRHSSQPMLESSVLNSALLKFMQNRGTWSGSATTLFNELRQLITDNDKKDSSFPKRANQLTRELNKSITTLKQFGIDYQPSDPNNHKERIIALKYTPACTDNTDSSMQDDTTDNTEKNQDRAIGVKDCADVANTSQVKLKSSSHSTRGRHSAKGMTQRVRPAPIKPDFLIDFDDEDEEI